MPPCSCPVGFGPDKCRAGDGPWTSPSRRAARPPRRRQAPLPRTGRTVNSTGHGAPAAAAWCQATRRAHGIGYGAFRTNATLNGIDSSIEPELWVPGVDILPLTMNEEASMLFFDFAG